MGAKLVSQRSRIIWALIILAGFGLSGCGNGSLIYHADYGRYSRSTAQYAARDGEMPLAVYGNPVGDQVAGIAEAVADGLYGTHVDYSTEFVPTERPGREGYRTVIVFGKTTQNEICSLPRTGDYATGSPTPVSGAFCLGDEVLSYVSGRTPKIDSADDPDLTQQVRAMGRDLFPYRNPRFDDDDSAASLNLP